MTIGGAVNAVDPVTKAISTVGTSQGILSDLVFAPDGTLYVANYANDSIYTVTAAGVFSLFLGGLGKPDGLAVDSDGSRLFVAHFPNDGRIDRVSLPGAVLTPGDAFILDQGVYTSGLVVDAADHLLVKTSVANKATIVGVNAP